MSAQIGLVGLGTMGAALALNIAEKGFDIAVWNRTYHRTEALMDRAGELSERLVPSESLQDFVASIAEPRTIILMVPAGKPVDDQIAQLDPYLGPDDMVVDAGNADFHDTNRRMAEMQRPFLGMGISGGEDGARHGPAIMGGGPKANWERVEHILHAIAAKHEGTPCADWMGEDGAGHFVKAVHNGIEYADMQLIAEVYGILRDGMGKSASEIAEIFAAWNEGPLKSYLIEITAEVAGTADPATGGPVLDVILDAAGQKGTGRWTAIEGQHLGAPISVIEAAVAARNMSAHKAAREELEALFGAAPGTIPEGDLPLEQLEQALICGKIICYDQGFRMIAAASREFGWSLDGARIARVWRQGCIIRSAMLDDMAAALAEADGEGDLMSAPYFADHLKATNGALRQVVATAVTHGAPAPALSSALSYFDTMRTGRGTANMIQGQRDFFGRHGFVRMDDGTEDQHGPWAD